MPSRHKKNYFRSCRQFEDTGEGLLFPAIFRFISENAVNYQRLRWRVHQFNNYILMSPTNEALLHARDLDTKGQ